MTVANIRYAYQTAPWDSPLSLGVQAFIEYNGYVINDRHQSDRIVITSIAGLDDPDSSDSREVVPGDHGENVYDSWYRGRTLVLTGRIEAGSMGTLQRLERDLKGAYAPLAESPLKFRWFDIYDGFDDPQTLLNYTPAIGSSAESGLTVSGGVLRWGTTQKVILMRSSDQRLYGDVQVTIRAVVGSITDASTIMLVPKLFDANDYLYVAYKPSTTALTINSVVGGATHQLATTPVTGVVQSQSVWLRARVEGDLVTAELWTTKPKNMTMPSFSTNAWLAGADADTFGDQVLSQAGFGASMADTNWALDDFLIQSLCPCDVQFPAKKMPNGMSIKETQSSQTKFTRALQITMRSSQYAALCATQSRSPILVPSVQTGAQLGRTYPRTYPRVYRSFVTSSVANDDNILSINNRGTAPMRPIIYVYGASGPFSIVNLTNGLQLVWDGTLADGDYLVFDCARRTLVNSNGSNMRGPLTPSTPYWLWLDPGWNDLYFIGSGYSANTKVLVWYQGGWM